MAGTPARSPSRPRIRPRVMGRVTALGLADRVNTSVPRGLVALIDDEPPSVRGDRCGHELGEVPRRRADQRRGVAGGRRSGRDQPGSATGWPSRGRSRRPRWSERRRRSPAWSRRRGSTTPGRSWRWARPGCARPAIGTRSWPRSRRRRVSPSTPSRARRRAGWPISPSEPTSGWAMAPSWSSTRVGAAPSSPSVTAPRSTTASASMSARCATPSASGSTRPCRPTPSKPPSTRSRPISIAWTGRPAPDALVGMGGAITNITAVKLGLDPYDPDAVHGAILERADIDRQIELYRSRDADARRTIVGLQPKRADVILAGACIVRTVMEKLGQDTVTVSARPASVSAQRGCRVLMARWRPGARRRRGSRRWSRRGRWGRRWSHRRP